MKMCAKNISYRKLNCSVKFQNLSILNRVKTFPKSHEFIIDTLSCLSRVEI